MRILSQDGRIDLPYENFSLNITQDNCIVAARDVVARPTEMLIGIVAKYSTEAKARRAMEMLHEEYAGIPLILQNVDISDDVKEAFEKWKKQGICVMSENQPSKVEYVGNILFQFPADNEVEV